jgi:hypothetical protein
MIFTKHHVALLIKQPFYCIHWGVIGGRLGGLNRITHFQYGFATKEETTMQQL